MGFPEKTILGKAQIELKRRKTLKSKFTKFIRVLVKSMITDLISYFMATVMLLALIETFIPGAITYKNIFTNEIMTCVKGLVVFSGIFSVFSYSVWFVFYEIIYANYYAITQWNKSKK